MGQASTTQAAAEQIRAIKLDPERAWDTVYGWFDGFMANLPNFIAALVIFLLFVLFGWVARRIIERAGKARGRENLGQVLGNFVRWTIILAGLLIAATVVIPSLVPGDLVAGLGIGSVAIGFAFKDILQNWLAGLLLLFRRPFRTGDQIEVEGYEGTVERIESRATIIRTFDGERVVIPNAQIYTNSVRVRTAYGMRRTEYGVGIGYGDDIDEAVEVIRAAVEACEGVEEIPPVDVLPWELGESAVTILVRWWTESARVSEVTARARVIRAIKYALDKAGIDMPYETQVLLVHDQTEESDGLRGAQREGWPVPKGEELPPRPRWKAEAEEAKAVHTDG